MPLPLPLPLPLVLPWSKRPSHHPTITPPHHHRPMLPLPTFSANSSGKRTQTRAHVACGTHGQMGAGGLLWDFKKTFKCLMLF